MLRLPLKPQNIVGILTIILLIMIWPFKYRRKPRADRIQKLKWLSESGSNWAKQKLENLTTPNNESTILDRNSTANSSNKTKSNSNRASENDFSHNREICSESDSESDSFQNQESRSDGDGESDSSHNTETRSEGEIESDFSQNRESSFGENVGSDSDSEM
jgi:hypothetical protein